MYVVCAPYNPFYTSTMNLSNSFHSVGGSVGRHSKQEDSPRFRIDQFQGIMLQQYSEKEKPQKGSISQRHNFQKEGFRRMLNSSSSNDRLMLPEMRNDSSMEVEGQGNYQTENSQESDQIDPMRMSFIKREESLSVLNSRRGESSESLSDCKSIIEKLCVEEPEKKEHVGCNCKKSKCLKLYCQCFESKRFCGESCGCYDCGNKAYTKQHQQAIYQALSRNHQAFGEQNLKQNRVLEEEQYHGFSLKVAMESVKRGCKCKKTKCLKKYCECYHKKEKCGVFCKCEGCENGEEEVIAMEVESLSESRIRQEY